MEWIEKKIMGWNGNELNIHFSLAWMFKSNGMESNYV
jgi:hypothetical protein